MLVPRRNFDIFDSFFDDPFFNSNENKMMKTDIKENENSYEVLIDLPGFNKEDIKMHIDNGYLVVSAKTNNEIDDKDEKGKFIRKERYYGECSRSFYVGEEVKEENIKASYKNGTLNIEIPKLEIEEKKSEKKYIEISD
ncbi:MAG: Hsp20/alpha crystallin family protein [Candidatus Coprovivens sp.]